MAITKLDAKLTAENRRARPRDKAPDAPVQVVLRIQLLTIEDAQIRQGLEIISQ